MLIFVYVKNTPYDYLYLGPYEKLPQEPVA